MLKVGNMAAAPGPLECTGRRTTFGPAPLPPINFVHDHFLVNNIITIFFILYMDTYLSVSKIIIIFSIVLGLG